MALLVETDLATTLLAETGATSWACPKRARLSSKAHKKAAPGGKGRFPSYRTERPGGELALIGAHQKNATWVEFDPPSNQPRLRPRLNNSACRNEHDGKRPVPV